MTDEHDSDYENDSESPAGPRIITASKFKNGQAAGKVEIHAHTKHGATSMVSVMAPDKLAKGDTLKTKEWILGAREFRVVGPHDRPMKLPGDWYVVQIIEAPSKPKPKPKSQAKSPTGQKPRR
ncbi:MAG: hypothetical protein V4692_15780 [Bdellovibrionota bacterium]